VLAPAGLRLGAPGLQRMLILASVASMLYCVMIRGYIENVRTKYFSAE
jgi:hypothetical protein